MRQIARTIHLVVAWLVVAGLVVQVWLAGRGVFDTSAGFAPHRDLGYTLGLTPLVLLVILQSVLVLQRDSNPSIAALHPVNGFLILFLAIVLALDSWRVRSAPA